MTAAGRLVRSRSPLLGKPLCHAMLLASLYPILYFVQKYYFNWNLQSKLPIFLLYLGKILTPSFA